jgi:CBS domain-containing protein
MRVRDVMSFQPRCCTPATSLRDVAQLMCDIHCGAIPVVDPADRKKPVGIITDRDICCRAVAKGKDPAETFVRECMSGRLVTIDEESSAEDCCEAMERAKVRRMLVVNRDGDLCGIVAQADIARRLAEGQTGEVLREISQPTGEPSLV